MPRLDKNYRTVDGGIEIVAEDASEIQPAIDEISEDVADGTISGGIVRLRDKAYYPKSTIFLKRGVTLRGARKNHKHVVDTRHTEHRQTTIRTSGLQKGATAYTWHHFNEAEDRADFDANHASWTGADYREKTHPHYPLIAGFDRQPIERDRDRTDYELRHRGLGAGLEGVVLEADDTRWWDYDEHGASDHWDSREHATYFGVFDGYLFEGLNYVHVEDVEVTGFRGYGGFYGDVNNVVSRGNFYAAGSTDYHGSALSLSTAGLEPGGTHGVWDVRVTGPTPTVELAGASARAKFVAGAWSRSKIRGGDPHYLGDEATFDADDHPIGPPSKYKSAAVFQTDQPALFDGYSIGTKGGVPDAVGIYADGGDLQLANTTTGGDRAGVVVGGPGVLAHNTKIGGGRAGIECVTRQGGWSNCIVSGDAGILLHPGAVPENGFDHVEFGATDVLATTKDGGGYQDYAEAVSLNNPDLRGCDALVADRSAFDASVDVATATGYKNAAMGVEEAIEGDGSATYAVAHAMDETPVHVTPLPTNATAQDAWPVAWSADDAEITFTFADAIAGGDTATFSWTALGWSHPMRNVQGT